MGTETIINLGGRLIGPDLPCFIIAEAGVNHNGDVEMARRLVDAALDAGADAVKFQTFKASLVAGAAAPKAEYQQKAASSGESQLTMLENLELSAEDFAGLAGYCSSRGLVFLSTPFDRESVDLLAALDVPAFKIASGEITNWPLLEHVAQQNKPVILSTGLSYLSEVDEAVRVLRRSGCGELALLHCLTDYPADPAQVNLRAMELMAAAFRVPVGYSDHTSGLAVAAAATALGACIIEKHFTLDRNLPGPDHQASLEPGELRELVRTVRTVEAALGHGRKEPAPSEEKNRVVVRRSLTAARHIGKGETIGLEMLAALRPADGISPVRTGEIVGRRSRRPLAEGQILAWSDLE